MKQNFRGRVMFLTFTGDGTAFGERADEFLLWLKRVRAIGEAMKRLRKDGWIGEYVCVAEFQKNGMIHYHAMVDAVKGYLPRAVLFAAWNQRRNRPDWAGEPGVFEGEGKMQGQTRPLVGFVHREPVDWSPGPDGNFVSPIVRYICGYMAKGGKNPTPQWFVDLCDGKLDGKHHHAVLFSSSRGFFQGVRVRRARSLNPKRRGLYKRWTVRQRLQRCRLAADVLLRIEHHRAGEIAETHYSYLGTFSGRLGYTAACYELWPTEVAGANERKRGCWLTSAELAWLGSSSEFMDSFKGPGKDDLLEFAAEATAERRRWLLSGCVGPEPLADE